MRDIKAAELITTRTVLADVAQRWREQYQREGEWTTTITGSAKGIYNKLRALNPATASRDDYDRVIGNASWTRITCDSCGLDVEAAVQMGEEPDYESHTVIVCQPCVEKALALFSAPPEG